MIFRLIASKGESKDTPDKELAFYFTFSNVNNEGDHVLGMWK